MSPSCLLGGWFADRSAIWTLIGANAVLVAAFGVLYLVGAVPALVAVLVLLWGLVGFGLVPSLQYRVIHLAGESVESHLDAVIELNVRGTHNVLEAARQAGVARVVLASSHHVVGFTHRGDVSERIPANAPARPDTLYAWSKAALETAGQLYADRFGIDVTCVRIGTFRPVPLTHRDLALWLSVDDAARLVEACLANPVPGFRIVWGLSRNTRGWGSLDEGAAIGYHPMDDAEDHLESIVAEHGEPDFTTDSTLNRAGGSWCDIPLGVSLRSTHRP
jgi:uronate dehydrogenase